MSDKLNVTIEETMDFKLNIGDIFTRDAEAAKALMAHCWRMKGAVLLDGFCVWAGRATVETSIDPVYRIRLTSIKD